jgi:hypothetical protein
MIQLANGTAAETAKVRIHNDLANAAFYFKNIITDKQKNGGACITLDCMACATMLAFTWEAYLNFFSSELLKCQWNEAQPLEDKENKVLEKLGLKPDWGTQPQSSKASKRLPSAGST